MDKPADERRNTGFRYDNKWFEDRHTCIIVSRRIQ